MAKRALANQQTKTLILGNHSRGYGSEFVEWANQLSIELNIGVR